MSNGDDNSSARLPTADAIRARAREIQGAGESFPGTGDAELLAGLADSTLSLDDADDHTLERCVHSMGIDAVVNLLSAEVGKSGQGDSKSSHTKENAMVSNDTIAPVFQMPAGRLRAVVTKSSPALWIGLAASVVVASSIFFLARQSHGDNSSQAEATQSESPAQQPAMASVILQWPSNAPFNPVALKAWGAHNAILPKGMPDFGRTVGTLGAGGDDRFANWRFATVIVRSEDGWGSGAVISPDGWIITNYHVVADAAQTAAVSGKTATLDIITAHMVDGRVKPEAPLKARLYRADPVHDLSLLKLDSLPPDSKQMQYFPLAAKVQEGEDCYVIGSQYNGPAWWIRSGNVSQQFDFPDDLSQFAAGVDSSSTNIDRDHATVIVTDARISPGDSGGPLLNAKGELIGLTFATSANQSAGSVGWHIALPHLRTFLTNLPTEPEGVPFDTWTAGLPEATMLEPELADGDHDGRVDSLRYRYAARAPGDSGTPQAVAYTLFIDFSERTQPGSELLDKIPFGLWGMERRGRFHFDLSLMTRADGVTAVGYPNGEGILDTVRIGTSRQDNASIIWRRDPSGKWTSSKAAPGTTLLDTGRLGANNLRRLEVMMGQIAAPRAQERPGPAEGTHSGPNKQ